MRAARSWGLPPGALAERPAGPPRHIWTARDRALALGLQELEDSRHACGQPSFESFDPDGPDYHAAEDICRACAVLEEANKQAEGVDLAKGLQRFLNVDRDPRRHERVAPNFAALMGLTPSPAD